MQGIHADQNGIAIFSRRQLFPEKQPHATLFIAETPDGPVLRLADAGSGYTSGSEDTRPAARHRAVIISDRNLYRPGQIVKMKGMLRDATETGLEIPTERDVHFRVMEGDGDHHRCEWPCAGGRGRMASGLR